LAAGSGHSATVRCCTALRSGRLITGGEDSRVCCWKFSDGDAIVSSSMRGTSSSTLKADKTKHTKSSTSNNNRSKSSVGGGSDSSVLRHKPY